MRTPKHLNTKTPEHLNTKTHEHMNTKTPSKITCIIVDDEKQARDRFSSLLGKFKEIKLLTSEEDPDEAIEQIILHEPDIAFIDIEMPLKSGLDVVKEVRETDVATTFIFVTGYNHYAIKAIKNAAFDYILKPIDIDELRETIERYKNQNKNQSTSEVQKEDTKKEYKLSVREKEIIKYLAQGKTSKEIAEQLFISKHTVDTHRRNILEKTGLQSTAELISFAYQKKLV